MSGGENGENGGEGGGRTCVGEDGDGVRVLWVYGARVLVSGIAQDLHRVAAHGARDARP